MKKVVTAREKAARVLCRRQGLPEDTQFEGRPMWESFLPDVDLVLTAICGPSLHASIDEWIATRQNGAPVSAGDLLSLLLLLPADEVVMIEGSGEYANLLSEMVSVGEKSERLYIEASTRAAPGGRST